jgi:Gas vesicle synthesis protein GvpL/GvpF
MLVLPYCLAELQSVAAPEGGVGGLSVESLEQNGLQCFFSRTSNRDQILGPAARETALAFHNVIASIFRHVAVIPFRFPTILEDEKELRTFLSEQESTYREALIRLRNLVQMEVHVLHNASSSSKQADQQNAPTSASGAQYLRARQAEQRKLADLSTALRRSGGSLVQEWRERPSAQGLRCFALVERRSIDDFKNLMLGTEVPSDFLARVTGPWPASEFIKQS